MKKRFKRTMSSHVATMYLRQIDSPISKDSSFNQQAVLQQLISLSFQVHQKIWILQYLSKVLVALFPAIQR
uniref:Mitochondrial carrier protein n=1 Tax=Solanum tuberosum TaxID=4113 RepID=M1BMB8_SOLTU